MCSEIRCSRRHANFSASGRNQVVAQPKHKAHQDDDDRAKRERQEKALDEALANTFPASDPVSAEQP